ENCGLASGDIRDGDVTNVSRVARFLHGVKCDLRAVGRNRRKDSIGNFFLGRAIKISDVNSVATLESDAMLPSKCCDGGSDQDESESDYFSHGIASVTKKVAASATERTIR